MGCWTATKLAVVGAAAAVVGYIAKGLAAATLAVTSLAFAVLVVIVVVLVVTAILMEVLGPPGGTGSVVEEDYSNLIDANEFLYQASIHWDNQHYCSGALIGTYFVLTVAQCVYNFVNNKIEKSKLKVYPGIREVPTYSKYGYDVDKITIHPNFGAQRLAYNMAVLKLTKEVTEPYDVLPITLPSVKMKMEDTTVLVGGFTNLDTPTVKASMTKTKMKIIKFNICDSHFSASIATGLKFCAIPAYRWKPCQTSRGGTAANEEEILVGLYVMKNPGGCAKNNPEIFVDVRKFLDFIKDATK